MDELNYHLKFKGQIAMFAGRASGNCALGVGQDILSEIKPGHVSNHSQEFPDHRTFSNLYNIKSSEYFSSDIQEMVSKQDAHALSMDVVSLKTEQQPVAIPTRIQTCRGNDRNPHASPLLTQKKGLGPRCLGTLHQSTEPESGSHHDNYLDAKPLGALLALGTSGSFKRWMGSLSRLKVLCFGYLVTPAYLPQQASYVFRKIDYTKDSLVHFGNSICGPHIDYLPNGLRTSDMSLSRFSLLRCAQSRRNHKRVSANMGHLYLPPTPGHHPHLPTPLATICFIELHSTIQQLCCSSSQILNQERISFRPTYEPPSVN